jgi:hypothetical protein
VLDNLGEPPGEQHSHLRAYLDLAQRFENMLLHHTASSLGEFVARTPDGGYIWQDGPSKEWVLQAYHAAFWSYGHLVIAMNLHWDRPNGEFRDMFMDLQQRAFMP